MEKARKRIPPQIADEIPQVTVTLDWSAAAAVEPQHINQVMAQIGVPAPDGVPDGIYVTLGNVLPPAVGGTDEESQRHALETLQGSTVPVAVPGRFHMSRGVLNAIIDVLQATAAQYDAAVRQAEAGQSATSRENG